MDRDAFRKFQEELAALERKNHLPTQDKPLSRMDHAKADFLAVRKRYGLTVADVVAFFPEEEGIAYLQGLLEAAAQKPVRKPRAKKPA